MRKGEKLTEVLYYSCEEKYVLDESFFEVNFNKHLNLVDYKKIDLAIKELSFLNSDATFDYLKKIIKSY